MFTVRKTCRACGSNSLESVLNLGDMCINAFPLPTEADTPKVPLDLTVCHECSLVQLRHTVDPDLLYRNFWYRSSVTKTMTAALANVVHCLRKRVVVLNEDVVCDVGSNDSTLLRCWPDTIAMRIGFEPAQNLLSEARMGGITVVGDYFSADAYKSVTAKKAQAITACAMFYDLESPGKFLQDVKTCLNELGVLCLQLSYLPDMIDKNDFSAVCHEHLAYYSLTSLCRLLAANGLPAYDVEFNDVNAGSMRVYACQAKRKALSNTLESVLEAEKTLGLDAVDVYRAFGLRVKLIRSELLELIAKARQPIYLLGASTKAQIMLQYFGLSHLEIAGASERDSRKVGRHMVGTRIPIVSEAEARAKAKTFICGIFGFRAEVLDREKEWLSIPGNSITFPFPKVETVNGKTLGLLT